MTGTDEEKTPQNESGENNDPPQHIIRVLGSYSLFTFFNKNTQNEFLRLTSDPEFQDLISKNSAYTDGDLTNFTFVQEAQNFEMDMVKEGFIREAPWKEAFLPIFQFSYPAMNYYCENRTLELLPDNPWSPMLLDKIFGENQKQGIWEILVEGTSSSSESQSLILFLYALAKIPRELHLSGERKIYVSLHKFGLANCGINIFSPYDNCHSFKKIAKDLYEKAAHLQEDPLLNFREDFKATHEKEVLNEGQVSSFLRKMFNKQYEEAQKVGPPNLQNVVQAFRNVLVSFSDSSPKKTPRLIVSYFQALSIAVIHQFLFEQLTKFSNFQFSSSQKQSWYTIASTLVNIEKKKDPGVLPENWTI